LIINLNWFWADGFQMPVLRQAAAVMFNFKKTIDNSKEAVAIEINIK
jgi:hypothetical protein